MAPNRSKQYIRLASDAQPSAFDGLVQIEGPGEKSEAFTGNSLRGLKFVDVTPRYLHGSRDSGEQKSIRVHVMQDYLRQKKLPIHAIEPPAMAGTVSDHVHRFRIAKPRLRGDKHAEPLLSSEQAVTCPEERDQTTRSRRRDTAPTRGALDLQDVRMVDRSPCSKPTQVESARVRQMHSALTPRIMPNLPGIVARMDPFARLPIDGTTQTHEIMDYCK